MITSAQNAQIKHIIALKKRNKYRKENDSYLVEGAKMYFELPKEEIKAVYISKHYEQMIKDNREQKPSHPYEVVADEVFSQMSDTQNPQGILAIASMRHYTLADVLKPAKGTEAPLIMVLENLQDPGNLGTILRAGEGAGISGVIMTKETVDIYNSKVIRATMGAMFRVPFVYVEDLSEAMAEVKKQQVQIYAAYLDDSTAYDQVDYTGGVAFMIGNEAAGLSDAAVRLSDGKVHIPMLGTVESLNAAVAASILSYEAARQRRNVKKTVEK